MPQLIEHIDAIARRKQCDVLYLEFHPTSAAERRSYQFEQDPVRTAMLAWLDQHALRWRECGPLADPRAMSSYRGQVHVDVPYDESAPTYQLLRDHLELPDGSMRRPGVRFYVLTLELALTNAEHDDPDFWTRWAADF